MTSWKFWLVMTAIGSFAALMAFGFTRDPKEVQSPFINKEAPSFTVTELNTGAPISSKDLRGTPYMLNFWASWCPACRDEAPILKRAYDQHELTAGHVRVLGIAIQDTPKAARRFAKAFGKQYYLALDDPTGNNALNWGVYGVPETFFVNADGIVVHKHIGAIAWKDVEEGVALQLQPRSSDPGLTALAPH